MKKNKILFILIAIFLININGISVKAASIQQLNCEYESILSTYCGDAGGDDCKVKINIKLQQNKWQSPTITWVNDYITGVNGCEAGDNVSDCLEQANVNNMGFAIVKDLKVIKKNNNLYEVTTDDYTSYFLNSDKTYYQCPSEVNVLRNFDTNELAVYVTNESFNENYCTSGSNIGEFSCSEMQSGRDRFPLTKQVSAMPYLGGEIDSSSSSGSCCIYEIGQGATTIYTYLLTSTTGVRSYAVCVGKEDCMTTDPNMSNFAAYMSQSDDMRWTNYHNLGDCNNMPKNIWISNVGDKRYFYPYQFGMKATLNPNKYCKSPVYSDDGVLDNDDDDSKIDWGDQVEVNCQGIIGEELLDFIEKIFRWIQIIAPIFVIIISSVEFAGAVLQDDKDALKKATNKFVKRLIIAVALFFVPLIVTFLLNIFNEITGAFTSICIE